MQGSDQHGDRLDALDAELFDSLWIEDEFGEAALEALVEDYCRSVLSVEEITAYRAAAGITEPAPALVLPPPATPVFQSTRCAA